MKKALLLCIVVVMALSSGCGNKEEAQETEVAVEEKAEKVEKELTPGEMPYEKGKPGEGMIAKKEIIVDAVTGEKILSGELPYTYEYKGKTYFFKTEENLNLFKQDPLKYIDEPE
jgi:YHS domain-containing protein